MGLGRGKGSSSTSKASHVTSCISSCPKLIKQSPLWMYHVTKAIIIMMSSPSWPQGHHQVHGLHHQTDQASSWTSDHHHLNWTNQHMSSTISSSNQLDHGLHHIIRVLMGQYQLIMSTSINLATSYCDHCKGHHQVSRLSS